MDETQTEKTVPETAGEATARATEEPHSARTTVRRGKDRAMYDDRMFGVLDAGMVAHVGVGTPTGPVVLPMAYGWIDGFLYLHGAAGNAMLRAAVGTEICVTVTILDGLVIARSPFHNSMNYRSVVVRGVARAVEGVEKNEALRVINDHIVENWASGRLPTEAETRRTLVLKVPLTEMSGKMRAGDPVDEPEDLHGPHWAGQLPIDSTWGETISAADLVSSAEPPPAVADLAGKNLP